MFTPPCIHSISIRDLQVALEFGLPRFSWLAALFLACRAFLDPHGSMFALLPPCLHIHMAAAASDDVWAACVWVARVRRGAWDGLERLVRGAWGSLARSGWFDALLRWRWRWRWRWLVP